MTLIRKSPCLLDLFCAMFFLTFGNLTLDYSLWMTAFSMNTLWLALHRHIRGQGRYVWVAAPVWCWPFPGEWVWDLRKHLPKENQVKNWKTSIQYDKIPWQKNPEMQSWPESYQARLCISCATHVGHIPTNLLYLHVSHSIHVGYIYLHY